MSFHLGGVSTYACFVLYIVSKWDQTNDIHLSRLSTSAVSTNSTFCTDSRGCGIHSKSGRANFFVAAVMRFYAKLY